MKPCKQSLAGIMGSDNKPSTVQGCVSRNGCPAKAEGTVHFGNGLITPSLRVARWGVEAMLIVSIAVLVVLSLGGVSTAKNFYFLSLFSSLMFYF